VHEEHKKHVMKWYIQNINLNFTYLSTVYTHVTYLNSMPVQYTTQLRIENISILLINKINSKKNINLLYE